MADAKRFLLMKSGYEVNILWLDSHGSCSHYDSEGSLYHTRYHRKTGSDGKNYVLLCPNGLEGENEWSRVFVDDPPGSWLTQFTNYKNAPPKRTHASEEEA